MKLTDGERDPLRELEADAAAMADPLTDEEIEAARESAWAAIMAECSCGGCGAADFPPPADPPF